MKLRQLELFSRLVEAGSFTRAAHALGITKSSASRELKQLEAEVGVRLLQRTTRSLKITEAGRLYHEHVRAALDRLEQGSNAVARHGREPRGAVRLTAPPHLGAPLVQALGRFLREHPMIDLELSFSSRVVDLVQEGFDVAIRVGRMRDSSLIARRAGDETLGLFASADYLARRGRPRRPADLAEHEVVLFRSPTGGHVWRDSLMLARDGRSERAPIHGRLELDEILFVRDAVAVGIGIGVVPLFLRDERLVRVLPRHVISATPVFVVTPTPKLAPDRVVRLRDFLIEALGRVFAAR